MRFFRAAEEASLRRSSRQFGFLIFALASCFLAVTPQAAHADALKYFKSYFVEGDYTVAGVGLRGLGATDSATKAIVGGTNDKYAKGTLHFAGANSIPAGA